MSPICPLVGTECLKHGCEWYDSVPAKPETFKCRMSLITGMLEDVANITESARTTSEAIRALEVEKLRSSAVGTPSMELLRMAGLEDIPRKDINPR